MFCQSVCWRQDEDGEDTQQVGHDDVQQVGCDKVYKKTMVKTRRLFLTSEHLKGVRRRKACPVADSTVIWKKYQEIIFFVALWPSLGFLWKKLLTKLLSEADSVGLAGEQLACKKSKSKFAQIFIIGYDW